jgi:hypothetical protein
MSRRGKQQSRISAALKKVLDRVLMVLLALLCIGAFYLAVILAEVPADQNAPKASEVPQVSLAPEQPRQIGSLNDLSHLAEHFPAPVLALQASDQLMFLGGLANDLANNGGFARLVTLNYQTPSGLKLMLYSIYPADALILLPDGDYMLTNSMTAALAGMTAVRMEDENTIRLHVRGESALYALTAPKMEEEALLQISRQAMLVTP